MIGNGGMHSALAEYPLVEDCQVCVSVRKIREDIPFEVTALNEPMAVALHAVTLMAELDLRWAMGYPTEIFDVTDQLAEHWEKFAPMISHRIPFADLQKGFDLLTTPSGAVKVSILFD
ncbi:hypothetical protein [Cellulomonas chengniuliangii]|uniref:hypothetical protein n=1 Tax=Cellulomonas chengniuliangii TaxID=2968084 RepID=UPI001D0F1022|nr:hypothetical protein [Cellulomonas chengniuliangii]MCC2317104.1 hypothetical protein [Cellulomonas chengniuliangii]